MINIDDLVNEMTLEQLPDVITDIAVVIGYDKTVKLVQRLGGIDFAMPTGSQDSSRAKILVDTIGSAATEQLMKRFGGARLYIPRCHAACLWLRNQEFVTAIEMAVARGSTQTAAIQKYAPQYGFTERWAYQILSNAKKDDNQPDLF